MTKMQQGIATRVCPRLTCPIPHLDAIFHSVPLSRRNEHFYPNPAWLNPRCSSSPPYLNWWTNYSLCDIVMSLIMKKGKDLLNAYLAGLKNGCSSVRLWSLQIRQLRECLCKSGPVDFAWDTDFARFSCVVRHSCTYTKTTIGLIGSLYFSEFYGN